jgi:hypothetical protein
VINYRKRPWLPVAVLLTWFAWLTGMSLLGQTALPAVKDSISASLIFLIVWGTITFGLPWFVLIRWVKDRRKAR